MIQVNLFTKQKSTHRHRKQTYGYQRGKGVGVLIGSSELNRPTPIYKIDK